MFNDDALRNIDVFIINMHDMKWSIVNTYIFWSCENRMCLVCDVNRHISSCYNAVDKVNTIHIRVNLL